MEGSKMEGSKMKCGEGVKGGQSENTGEGGWCCSTNKYGVVSPTSNYLVYHHHIVFLIHFIILSLSSPGRASSYWSQFIPIDCSQVFFIQCFFKTSPLAVECLCCSFHNFSHPCTPPPI